MDGNSARWLSVLTEANLHKNVQHILTAELIDFYYKRQFLINHVVSTSLQLKNTEIFHGYVLTFLAQYFSFLASCLSLEVVVAESIPRYVSSNCRTN